MSRNQIPESEWKIMKVLWEKQPLTANQIIERLDSEGWSPRTIRTLISRLVKKEVVAYDKVSREYYYYATVEKATMIESESKSFLEKFFDNSVNRMVTNFIESGQMSDEDINELKNILRDKGEE